MFGLLALHSSFVLAVDMDLVVDMCWRLPGVPLEANYFGQDMENLNQVMHSNSMDPKPSLTLEQNFAAGQRTEPERARVQPEDNFFFLT